MTQEALAAIHAQCFSRPRPWSANEFAHLLADPACILLHMPEGFALGRVVVDEAELLTIAILPQHQGKGLGQELLASFLARAWAQGARTVFLEVAEDNTAARALYRRAGFAEAGRRRGYYSGTDGAKIDALVLRRVRSDEGSDHQVKNSC